MFINGQLFTLQAGFCRVELSLTQILIWYQSLLKYPLGLRGCVVESPTCERWLEDMCISRDNLRLTAERFCKVRVRPTQNSKIMHRGIELNLHLTCRPIL
jgi:hypothetical protein